MLNAELSEKLKFLADSGNIQDDEFLALLGTAKAIIVANATGNSKGVESTNANSAEVTAGLTALLALITESIRQNKTQELRGFLTEQGFASPRADLVVKLQDNIKSATLLGLKSVQSPLPRVFDANWSLNYTDKDSSSERVGALEYQLELQTLDSEGKEKPVKFACDLNEMQDLVSKLKEACKHVERVSSSN